MPLEAIPRYLRKGWGMLTGELPGVEPVGRVDTRAGQEAIERERQRTAAQAQARAASLAQTPGAGPAAVRQAQMLGTQAELEAGEMAGVRQRELEQAAIAQELQARLQAQQLTSRREEAAAGRKSGLLGGALMAGAAALLSEPKTKREIRTMPGDEDESMEVLQGRPRVLWPGATSARPPMFEPRRRNPRTIDFYPRPAPDSTAMAETQREDSGFSSQFGQALMKAGIAQMAQTAMASGKEAKEEMRALKSDLARSTGENLSLRERMRSFFRPAPRLQPDILELPPRPVFVPPGPMSPFDPYWPSTAVALRERARKPRVARKVPRVWTQQELEQEFRGVPWEMPERAGVKRFEDVVMSDRDLKEHLSTAAGSKRALGGIKPYTYRYKPEVASAMGTDTERRAGIMADELAESPNESLRHAVVRTPMGLAIDRDRALSAALAAAAGLDKRIRQIEARR